MLKYGVNLLFVIFSQLIFVFTLGAISGLAVVIFLIEFTIAGYIINEGYNKEIRKKSEEK